MPTTDIAIIGVGCRFSGDAKSPEAFHEMLVRGRDAWSEVPPSRYNLKAFHHPSRERKGTTVSRGGYFLNQNLSEWDAPFFGCSAAEARGFDPQQRLLLEVAYESLENAGVPVEAIAGTEAACFVGCFSSDYKKVVSRDLQAAPQYSMTGCAATMLANRISWFFNLHGPSVTVDTACSSSMAALHLACETIRSESNATRTALVGGANIILGPEDTCALNALGFLSPDGRCFSFDSRANGYARGEGIGMIVLKHVDDAIRDGDPIRAVIRATGLNSDGRTAGIILPSGDAQQRLILNTYWMADLDPTQTQYVELHGTGTKVGDPAEVGAVARTIAAERSDTLYCGSVKTQIGHTEGASGVGAVIKCVLAMEKGIIPPNCNLSKPNPRLRLESSNITVPTKLIPWPECEIRRCSINNFGFGGTNAHAILDYGRDYLRHRGMEQLCHLLPVSAPTKEIHHPTRLKAESESTDHQAYLFVLSAPEKDAIMRQRQGYADYVEKNCTSKILPCLANTLSDRRSIFQWRHAVVARSVNELSTQWKDDGLNAVKASTSPNIVFVFTGQGAQWHAMGRELLSFHVFATSVRDSAAYLLTSLGCPWDAWSELTASKSESRVNQAEFSQPLCLVLQIALVDLLDHWGVKPFAVVGHSSGEIAAAYAARALSKEDCLKIAYHRGIASKVASSCNPHGSMMAVELSMEEVELYLDTVAGSVVVACINSPYNITLAGDKASLDALQTVFKQKDIFCRLLHVENAYHSPQMLSVSEEYWKCISDIAPLSDSPAVAFYSTVKGRQITACHLTADYWVDNMCGTVQLVAALDDMIYADIEAQKMKTRSNAPSLFIEIGPHAALGGPIKQFKAARGGLDHLTYHSMLFRDQDASTTAMAAAGALWARGAPVNLNKVNNRNKGYNPSPVIINLPSYPWNHSTSYWSESRQSINHRSPAFPRHDIVGSLLEDYNPLEPVWKNHLRVSELPWLKDHRINGDVVFPAAGMVCAALEAVRQVAAIESPSQDVSGFELREISISKPLVIPEDDTGVETFLHLKPRKHGMGSGTGPWLDFSFYSAQEGGMFVEHAWGMVQIERTKKATEVDDYKELEDEVRSYREMWTFKQRTCEQRVTILSHYEFCDSQNMNFGKTFRNLIKLRQNGWCLAFESKVPDTRGCLPAFCESEYLIHPVSLDAVFQSMLVTIPRMDGVEKQAWVPTSIDSMRISTSISRGYGAILHGICESSLTSIREMTGSLVVGDGKFDTLPGLILNGLKFKGLGATQNLAQVSDGKLPVKLFASTVWKPDISLLDEPDLQKLLIGNQYKTEDMEQFCSSAYNIVNEMCRLALAKLDVNSQLDSLPPHLKKFVEWMRRRCEVSKTGVITTLASPERLSHQPEKKYQGIKGLGNFIEKYPIDGKVLLHAFYSLDNIFAQKAAAVTTEMADDSFSKYYGESQGLRTHIQIYQKWFDLRTHKSPSLRVIEIGAGTASATLPVLKQLGDNSAGTPRFSQWMCTDVSPSRLENAKTVLCDWKSHVEYKVLDIESDPIEQGFEVESYDVVLAVNALHATKHIGRALENCRRLLKRGGNLVLGEYTNPDDMINFLFGAMPGWWAAEDGRENGPLLLASQWDYALKEAGFSGVGIALSDCEDVNAHRMSTLISTKPHKSGTVPLKELVIVVPDGCGDATKKLASSVCHEFKVLGADASFKELTVAVDGSSGKTIISLLDYEAAFLEEASKARFEQTQHLLLHSRELLWVTRSDAADGEGHPAKRIISGLLRCLKTEDASRRLYELHLCRDLGGDIGSASSIISRRLRSIWGAGLDELEEMETVEKDGVFCIPRYMPEKAMNDSLAQTTEDAVPQIGNLLQANRPLKLTIRHPGMLDTLYFVDDDSPFQPLLDEEVVIQVQACALNFLDIMIAMGQIQRPVFGHEAAGIIRRVGTKVTRFSPGDRVIYLGQGAMRTCIRSHESAVLSLPASISLEEGVSIPIAYATAYRSLVEVARLEKGESVLIHAAAGGLGQALIQIAKMLGAEIYCTVGTKTKKQAIIDLGVRPDRIFSSRDLSFAKGIKRLTGGRGVDVVVNSLAGEALRQSWWSLAPYGRFIEVGKRDMLGNSGLDMQPFLKNIIFAGVNVEDMLVHEPRRCANLLSKVLKLFEQGAISFIRPIVVHDFTEVESVFRKMQRGTHIGKLVLRLTIESRVLIAPRKFVPLSLNPNATYLLVGGFGGLGRAQAQFMARHGARHIAFLSRSGSSREEAKNCLAKLTIAGVDARSYACDIADKAQLKASLFAISQDMPPIRGVIQGAMALADCVFHKMTYEQWVIATRPKIQGSWNLHEMLPDSLDFFVVLSSLAGVIGSVSQANYAAGNTFQDALIHYRHRKGLSGQSLNLGVMKGIGYVEEHEDVGARLSPLRLTSVDEQQFMHILRCALSGTADGECPLAKQLLVGAGSGGIMQAAKISDSSADFYWLRTLPQFAYLREMDIREAASTGDESKDEESKLVDRLRLCKSMDEANEITQGVLLASIARVISIPIADIDTAKPVYTYGVDSLVAVELRNWLAISLKTELSIFTLMSSAPISEVSNQIASKSQLIPTIVKVQNTLPVC